MSAPVPSVIQVTAYRDGILLQGSGPQIYVIDEGQRRYIPDVPTFETRGFIGTNILRISDPELLSIPDGPALVPDRRGEVTVNTFLGAGQYRQHMYKSAYLLADGALIAVTRTRALTRYGGFIGRVQVVMGDTDGVAIGTTPMRRFAVDGSEDWRWKLAGASDRTDSWTEKIDPAIVEHTASLSVTHARIVERMASPLTPSSWTPKVSMEEMVRSGIDGRKLVSEIIQTLEREGFAGGGTGPVSSSL